jgi:hypothetical protein
VRAIPSRSFCFDVRFGRGAFGTGCTIIAWRAHRTSCCQASELPSFATATFGTEGPGRSDARSCATERIALTGYRRLAETFGGIAESIELCGDSTGTLFEYGNHASDVILKRWRSGLYRESAECGTDADEICLSCRPPRWPERWECTQLFAEQKVAFASRTWP